MTTLYVRNESGLREAQATDVLDRATDSLIRNPAGQKLPQGREIARKSADVVVGSVSDYERVSQS
jgi:hypothetical protein